jgi:hypothetical protein
MFKITVWPNVEHRGNVAIAESGRFSIERVNCSVGTWSFRVGKRYASLHEFGSFEREIDYGECACVGIGRWIPETRPDRVKRVCGDLGLTWPEWNEIQDALTQLMPFRCAGCMDRAEPAIRAIRLRALETKGPA